MQAVRGQTQPGDVRIGRLEGDTVVDAGPSDERGFVPTEEAIYGVFMVRPGGFEPPTRGLEVRRSVH
jgi:hypothetical protein